LTVEALNKPSSTPCKHLRGDGCSIYRKRPADCREFECLWLSGFGPEEHRPDRVGYLELLTYCGDKLAVLLTHWPTACRDDRTN
jgi:Fe-S-cluster containining protein